MMQLVMVVQQMDQIRASNLLGHLLQVLKNKERIRPHLKIEPSWRRNIGT